MPYFEAADGVEIRPFLVLFFFAGTDGFSGIADSSSEAAKPLSCDDYATGGVWHSAFFIHTANNRQYQLARIYGEFTDIPVPEDKLLIRYVGLEPTLITLADTCEEVEVIAMLWVTFDFASSKKIDRLRMKSLRQLPYRHKQAFEKGIFKTLKACYTQEFIYRYPKKE